MSLDAHNNYAYICLALVRAPWRHHKSAVPSANLFGPVEKILVQGSSAHQGQAIVHFLPGYHLQCLNGGPGRRRSSWLEIAQDSGLPAFAKLWNSLLNTIFGGNVNSRAARLLLGEVGLRAGMRCASYGHDDGPSL